MLQCGLPSGVSIKLTQIILTAIDHQLIPARHTVTLIYKSMVNHAPLCTAIHLTASLFNLLPLHLQRIY